MRFTLILLSIIFLKQPCFSQNINNERCKVVVFLSEYNVYFTPVKCPDSIWRRINKGKLLNINLEACNGKMFLKEMTKDSILIAEGAFLSSLDTLKQYSIITDIEPPYSEQLIVIKYFQPVKNGLWKFYSKNGKLKRQETWRNGILVK